MTESRNSDCKVIEHTSGDNVSIEIAMTPAYLFDILSWAGICATLATRPKPPSISSSASSCKCRKLSVLPIEFMPSLGGSGTLFRMRSASASVVRCRWQWADQLYLWILLSPFCTFCSHTLLSVRSVSKALSISVVSVGSMRKPFLQKISQFILYETHLIFQKGTIYSTNQ